MYETFFGFKDRPFSVSPSPACFFQAAEHQNVLNETLVTISSLNGITILTGDAGTGKTAVCRQLITRLEDHFQIQYIEHCNFPTVRALLQTLLYGLTDCYEKISEQELRLALTAEIRSSFLAHGQPLLVIVDEAHLLEISFLEELRVLSDIAFDGKPAVQLLLSGQTALEETLIQPALSSLNQRIGCQTYLDRMTRQESEEYIEYRINRVTSDERGFFSEEAIKFITHVSDGLPRCLNQICDHSLMLAYMQDLETVNEAIAREAFTDLQQLPLHWNDPLPVPSPLELLRKGDATKETALDIEADELLYEEIDEAVEDRLNQLMDDVSETETEPVEEEWDSADLFSFGEGIEAIEVGSETEPEIEKMEAEPVLETESEVGSVESAVEINQEALSIESEAEKMELVKSEPAAEFEQIIDRYAAIDAGLDPSTIAEETRPVETPARSVFQLKAPNFRFDPPSESAEPIMMESEDSVTDLPESGVDEPVEVAESSPVESPEGLGDSLDESGLKQLSPEVFEELAAEAAGGEGTFEELLAAQVYEVCAETRKGLLNALDEIRNYSIPDDEDESDVYDMVQPEDECEAEVESVLTEWNQSVDESPLHETSGGSKVRLDAPVREKTESSATAHLKGPALGRYKNLFSRLRRKQESL